jgi:hypothetical protein
MEDAVNAQPGFPQYKTEGLPSAKPILTSTYIVVVVLMLLASAASAQSIFVQGSAGIEVRRFSAETEKSAFDGAAPAVVLGIGTELMQHWPVSVQLSLNGESKLERVTDVVVFGQPRAIHNLYTSERRGLAVLAGYRTSAHRRARFGYYGGVSFSLFRREIASDAASIVLNTVDSSSVFEERLTTPVVAVDATVRIRDHFAVLATVVVQGLEIGEELGGHSIQSSIGARVSF